MCVNALSGIAFAPTELVAVLGVVPAVVPPLGDEPEVEVAPDSTVADLVSTLAEGVYFTDVVSALDPAEADADDENDVEAPAPLAPEDAFD
jgi:hypothetical protein